MDYLREGIHLRGFAQIDPLVAYKNEGFSMFEELMHSVWEEFSRLIFHVEVEISPSEAEQAFAAPARQSPEVAYSGGTLEAQPSALAEIAAAGGAAAGTSVADAVASDGGQRQGSDDVVETVVKGEHDKIGRNDPCWCGSGKKYKKCHGA
jgi:preprotein translocase subunit SecA